MRLFVTRKADYSFLLSTDISLNLQVGIKAHTIEDAAKTFCTMAQLYSKGKKLVPVLTGNAFCIYELKQKG